MGVLIDGRRQAGDPAPDSGAAVEFRRAQSALRDRIAPPGGRAPAGASYPAEAGRYHLHVAWNRPWANPALPTRVLKGLQDAITVSHARPRRTGDGWVYDSDGPFACPEPGVRAARGPCPAGSAPYGRVTVPVLWDRHTGRIVSSESADIVRMLDRAFGAPVPSPPHAGGGDRHLERGDPRGAEQWRLTHAGRP